MGESEYKLTYFNVCGLAEPTRWIFYYKKQPFQDERIAHEDFIKLKQDLPYNQLPILSWKGKILAQSRTIANFVADQLGMIPSDPWDSAMASMLVDATLESKEIYSKYWIEEDPAKKEKLKQTFINEKAPHYLSKLEKRLVANGTGSLVGSKDSWADLFVAYYTDCFVKKFGKDILNESPEVEKHWQRILNIEGIAEYLKNRPPLIRDI